MRVLISFYIIRLSQKYYHVVANPNDILLFRKCTSKLRKKDIFKLEYQDFNEIGEIFRFDNVVNFYKVFTIRIIYLFILNFLF
jgi:hypothetical protein